VTKQEELQNKAKLQKMSATRKGISSDDFNNDPQGDRETEYRYQQMKAAGMSAVSSDMMFGRASGPEKI
jgi:hypothetical protein